MYVQPHQPCFQLQHACIHFFLVVDLLGPQVTISIINVALSGRLLIVDQFCLNALLSSSSWVIVIWKKFCIYFPQQDTSHFGFDLLTIQPQALLPSVSNCSLSAATMVDAAAAEQFLDANPQFAKQYYDINFRPKVISDLLDNNRKVVLDVSKFHDLTMVEESEILFDLVRDIQDNLQMEKSVFNLMKHLSFIMRADRMSLFMYRQRNGVAELATRLLGDFF